MINCYLDAQLHLKCYLGFLHVRRLASTIAKIVEIWLEEHCDIYI